MSCFKTISIVLNWFFKVRATFFTFPFFYTSLYSVHSISFFPFIPSYPPSSAPSIICYTGPRWCSNKPLQYNSKLSLPSCSVSGLNRSLFLTDDEEVFLFGCFTTAYYFNWNGVEKSWSSDIWWGLAWHGAFPHACLITCFSCKD